MSIFLQYGLFIILFVIMGLYCIIATFNLIRVLIGLELMIKAVTLLLIVAGELSGHQALAQTLVITLIVIEVVVMVVGAGIVLGIHAHTGRLNVKNIRELKG